MAKVKKRPVLNSNMKRNLFVVAVVLITLGLLSFFMEYKNQKESEMLQFENENQDITPNKPKDIGPSKGCEAQPTGYVCSVKINNPSEKDLEWSAIIDGIEGASVSQKGTGILAAKSWVIVQLTVPQRFCAENPDGKGKVTILDNKKSTNNSQAEFNCSLL